jgi:hypothetical protein
MSSAENSFFRAVYSRHTNFATAECEQACNNTPSFGRHNIQTTHTRAGDLLSQQYLALQLPRIEYAPGNTFNLGTNNYTFWSNGIGFAMIDEIVCLIGNHDFDTQDGRYMYMREALAAKPDRKLSEEIGLFDTPAECATHSLVPQNLLIPLQFWYNNFVEQSLPMIGLYWHELRTDLDLKAVANLIQVGTGGDGTPSNIAGINLDDLHYLNTFQYLDRPERAMFANQKLEQIFGQVQFLGEETFQATDIVKQCNIRYNQPVGDIEWVFQSDAAITANDWFNFGGVDYEAGFAGSGALLTAPPYETAQMFLNSHQRTLEMDSMFFNNITAHRAHGRIPRGHFVSSYPFGIDSDALLHSGSVNFSRMDSAHMRFHLWPAVANGYSFTPPGGAALPWNYAGRIAIYARNYNLGKVSIGMMVRLFYISNHLLTISAYHRELSSLLEKEEGGFCTLSPFLLRGFLIKALVSFVSSLLVFSMISSVV